MKTLLSLLIIFTLSGCLADTADESGHAATLAPLASTQEALAGERIVAPPPGKREPTVVGETRTSWDDRIQEKLPKWEVYSLPPGPERDPPIIAVPKDGHGMPIALAFWHYHYEGDAYFKRDSRISAV
jgi:hypothetical protein